MRANKKRYLLGVLVILLDLVTKSVAGVICKFCNKDFTPLGRHTWCCKARVTQIRENIQINYQPLSPNATILSQNNNNEITAHVNQDPHENEKKYRIFRYYCGCEFKSLRGLNKHRRSCFVGKTPSIAQLFEGAVEEINDIQTDVNEKNLIDLIDLPKG